MNLFFSLFLLTSMFLSPWSSWANPSLYQEDSTGNIILQLEAISSHDENSEAYSWDMSVSTGEERTFTTPSARPRSIDSTPIPKARLRSTPTEDIDTNVGPAEGAETEAKVRDPITDKVIPPNRSGNEPGKKTVDWSKPIDFNSDDPFNEAHLRQGPTHEVRSKEGRLLYTYTDGWDHEGNPIRIIDGVPQDRITKEDFLATDFGERKPNNTNPFHVKERASSSRSKRRTGSGSRVENTPGGLATRGVASNGVSPLRGFSKNITNPSPPGRKKKSGKSVEDLALEKLRSEKWQTLGSGYRQRGRPHRGRVSHGPRNALRENPQGLMDQVALGLKKSFYKGLSFLGLGSEPEYSSASVSKLGSPRRGVKNRTISSTKSRAISGAKRGDQGSTQPRSPIMEFLFPQKILLSHILLLVFLYLGVGLYMYVFWDDFFSKRTR